MASERRSLRAAAAELNQRIAHAKTACEDARRDVELATAKLREAQATLFALQDAHALVKPTPRRKPVRKEPSEAVA